MPAKKTSGKPPAAKKAAKKAAAKKAVKPDKPAAGLSNLSKPRVRLRTYRHGLGDCHLLRFAKPDGKFLHMLIDCGIVDLPKHADEQAARMVKVAENIAKETKVLDIVVVTHQHTDHLSGFRQAVNTFKDIEMKALWFAWTEKKGSQVVKQIKDQLLKKLSAVREASARLAGLGTENSKAAADRINGVLDFFGPGAVGDRTQAILDDLEKKVPTTPEYYEPGDVFLLPGVPNVRVYVLGPPKNVGDLRITNPRVTKKEGYEVALSAAADGFADAMGADGERAQPFDGRYRIGEDAAKAHAFFKDHYFADEPGNKDPAWRRIDTAWLEMAEQLALALNDFTNNTSLALAFEFIDTKEIMLMPGDAQIGSWLTWHKLKWTVKEPDGTTRQVTIRDLFDRVVFYKAAHHASHNGTLSGLGENQTGLEHMTNEDLVCVVPVDVKMSIAKHWDRTLPWGPLLKRLGEKTRGRLVLTDASKPLPDPASLTELSAAEKKRFAKQVKEGKDDDNGMGWVDYIL